MSSEERKLPGRGARGCPGAGGSCGLAAWHGVLKSLVTSGGKAALPVRNLGGPLGKKQVT